MARTWTTGVALAAAAGFAGVALGAAPSAVVDLPNGMQREIDASAVVVDTVPMPMLDIDAERALSDAAVRNGEIRRFAVPFTDTTYTPAESGSLEDVGNGRVAWRLRFDSPNAKGVNLGTRYNVPASTELFLLDGEGRSAYRVFTAADNNESGELWTPVVSGNVLEIYAEVDAAEWDEFMAGFAVEAVNLSFIGFGEVFDEVVREGERQAACHIDVACSQADPWRTQVASVGAYTINGFGTCSGAMINNTSEDGTPYFMTAWHCGVRSNNDQTMVVYWNYENSVCRPPGSAASGNPGDGPTNQFTSGANVRMLHQESDWALVELFQTPLVSYGVEWIGWDRSGSTATDGIGIHHPGVEEKRISLEFGTPIKETIGFNNTAVPMWRVQWDAGGVEQGSSGSPLFDQNGRAIGTASAATLQVICTNQFTWYGRMEIAWNGGGTSSSRLSDWLDPLNTGQQTLDALGTAPIDPPEAFGLLSPSDGDTTVDADVFFSLQWESSVGADLYTVTVADDPSFSVSSRVVGPQTTTGTSLNIFAGTLDEGTQYYWTVTASNGGGDTVSTPSVYTFTTVSPVQPCAGDIDGDGDTGLSDFNTLAGNFGGGPGLTRADGDLDGDGFVGLNDFNLLSGDFGCIAGP